MTPSQLNVALAQARGWKLVVKGQRNPPRTSFRLCPICKYIGSVHEGREGMACEHDSEWVSAWDQWTKDGLETCEDPCFTTDPSASLDLIEFMRGKGYRFAVERALECKWWAGFHKNGTSYTEEADTFPLAVAKAAALALGISET